MIHIGSREVGQNCRPYIIAEMSGNHNQSLDRALAIVDAAASAGADAIKLQTYTADTMTLNVHAPGFVIDDPASLWAGRHLYELYDEAHTPWEWHAPLMARAADHGMHCFSTPFDDTVHCGATPPGTGGATDGENVVVVSSALATMVAVGEGAR